MIRPIESNISIYNVDHKAQQMKDDPSAHQFQAMRQGEIVKETVHQMQTVQKSPDSEGDVKIRDQNSDKNKNDRKKKKKNGGDPGPEKEETKEAKEPKKGKERLNFFA
jgi:hypothetical protein